MRRSGLPLPYFRVDWDFTKVREKYLVRRTEPAEATLVVKEAALKGRKERVSERSRACGVSVV